MLLQLFHVHHHVYVKISNKFFSNVYVKHNNFDFRKY